MNEGKALDWGDLRGRRPAARRAGCATSLHAQDGLYTLVLKDPDGTPRAPRRRLDPRVPARPRRPRGGRRADGRPGGSASSPSPSPRAATTSTPSPASSSRTTPDVRRRPRAGRGAADHASGWSSRRCAGGASAGSPPFTVMSCDNIQGNGDVAQRRLRRLRHAARPRARRLGRRDTCASPTRMVDRITPVHHRRRPRRGRGALRRRGRAGRWSASRSRSGCWRTTSASAARPTRTPGCRSSTTSSRTS